MDIIARIREIDEFQDIPQSQLTWLVEHSEAKTLQVGDFIFQPGDAMDHMFVILTGKYIMKIAQNNQFKVVANLEGPLITGLLPYSRAKEVLGYGETTREGKVLWLHKKHFREMIVEHEELTTALVHTMSTRIREFTKVQQQNEKLMSLGKLSAGLAHELNNPAAAVVRSAQFMKELQANTPEKFKRVLQIKLSDDQVDRVTDLLFSKINSGMVALSIMERSEKEDDLLDWLDDREVENSEDVADNLVDFGFTEAELDDAYDGIPEAHIGPSVNWMNQVLTTEKLVSEIEDASSRIGELVKSIKSYTHMDQSPEMKPIDIHEGLDNTLIMLNHKLKKSNIELIRDYDATLAQVDALPGALNQVWTNLIDNAIDAMRSADKRELRIETMRDGDFVNINVQDSGSGIPEDIQDKIFDPFFTTKEVGEGTGIGLELVHRIITNDHNGSIKVKSKPGDTVFQVCFPVKAS